MAIISCPHCGKRISDRTEVCPNCNTVLIQKNDEIVVSKEIILSDSKKSILGVVIATVEAFVMTRLVAVVLGVICKYFIGETGKRAFSEGSRAFQFNMFAILLVGLITMCVLPMILEKITKVKAGTFVIAISVVLAVVFGFSYASGSSVIKLLQKANVSPEVVAFTRTVPFFYAVSLPLYQGMFYLLNRNESSKKGYIAQAFFAAIALLITVILAVVAVMILAMGTQGAAFAGAIASLLMFIVASLRKK